MIVPNLLLNDPNLLLKVPKLLTLCYRYINCNHKWPHPVNSGFHHNWRFFQLGVHTKTIIEGKLVIKSDLVAWAVQNIWRTLNIKKKFRRNCTMIVLHHMYLLGENSFIPIVPLCVHLALNELSSDNSSKLIKNHKQFTPFCTKTSWSCCSIYIYICRTHFVSQ